MMDSQPPKLQKFSTLMEKVKETLPCQQGDIENVDYEVIDFKDKVVRLIPGSGTEGSGSLE